MITILVIENPQVNAVTWWRYLRPLSEMQKQFPGRYHIKMTRRLDEVDLYFVDIVLLSRPNDPETLNMVKRIKDLGRSKIIIDIDDAITNLPVYHDQAAYHNSRRHIAREIFSLVDFFWVSTPQLMFECDCFGRGLIMPNSILEQDLPGEPSPDQGLWMWRGRGMQKEDVYIAGVEDYERIKNRASRWIFWGCLPNLDHSSNVQLVEYDIDVQSYFAKLKNMRLNGVWKPLVVSQFNDAKSNIAWIEATMSGGVCLTNYAGREGWENAVNEFPEYEAAREIWKQSKQRILHDFNLENTARLRALSIDQLLSSGN